MINLYTLSDGKTRCVVEYVESLEVPIAFEMKEGERFKEIKKEALTPGLTANRMLDIIGYNPKGRDTIMDADEIMKV